MTPAQTNRLALVTDAHTSENQGDDSAPSLVELLDASVHEAMMNRIRMTEKRVERLYALPEIAAAMERMKNREAY